MANSSEREQNSEATTSNDEDTQKGNVPTTLRPQSSHLKTLLSKLRPFQRKAFDFAVHGVLLSGNDNDEWVESKDNASRNKINLPSKTSEKCITGDNIGKRRTGESKAGGVASVAGAGKLSCIKYCC